VIGVAAGAVQGYFGGWTDLLFQRFIEIWSSMPTLYPADHRSRPAAQTSGSCWDHAAVLVDRRFVGMVRAEFLRARNFEYVNAARALGVPTARSCSGTCCPTPWWRR
jgi:microcin C transport system permease protein